MAKKDQSGIEIIESAEALQKELGKAEGFFNQNKTGIVIAVAVILGFVLGFFGYRYYVDTQNTEAQAAMFDSVFYFEKDSLDVALNGTGGNMGLIEVAETYGSTPAGNLANMYVGTIYMQQGKYQEALEYLANFDASDVVLQGRAFVMMGDAHMELGNTDDAIAAYQKAADASPNKFTTPAYLMKLATACEFKGDKEGALEAYNELIEEYPNANEALIAKKYKSRLETETGE